MPDTISPFLWFDKQAEEAAELYCSLFPNSRILKVARYPDSPAGEPGTVMTVEFELDGRRFVALNGGPQYSFTEAVSFTVSCEDQDEIDRYWDALTADGGETGPCGWCKDRYGLSWQVVPRAMDELLADPDPDRASRAMNAMLGMRKLDIAALRAAADAAPAAG
jgi:predicted 3-demethylubiquinone-9 3-methyltransferase (glyoxalase superfamily)